MKNRSGMYDKETNFHNCSISLIKAPMEENASPGNYFFKLNAREMV